MIPKVELISVAFKIRNFVFIQSFIFKHYISLRLMQAMSAWQGVSSVSPYLCRPLHRDCFSLQEMWSTGQVTLSMLHFQTLRVTQLERSKIGFPLSLKASIVAVSVVHLVFEGYDFSHHEMVSNMFFPVLQYLC